MFELVFMDEAAGSSIINMPMPAPDAPEEEKDEFAEIYFERVLKKYKVMCNLFIFDISFRSG